MPKHKLLSKACTAKTAAAVTWWSTKPVRWSPALPVAAASAAALVVAASAKWAATPRHREAFKACRASPWAGAATWSAKGAPWSLGPGAGAALVAAAVVAAMAVVMAAVATVAVAAVMAAATDAAMAAAV